MYFILPQFNLNFCKLNKFVPLQIEIKFNFYINGIQIFLLKLIFLLNVFNKTKFIYIYILHWTLFKIVLKLLIENNVNRKKNQIIVLIFYYINL